MLLRGEGKKRVQGRASQGLQAQSAVSLGYPCEHRCFYMFFTTLLPCGDIFSMGFGYNDDQVVISVNNRYPIIKEVVMKRLQSVHYGVCSWIVFFLALCIASQGPAAAAAAGAGEPRVKCRVETDRQVFPADIRQTAIVKITLDAPPPPVAVERPLVNLSIVLDRSGSMAGSKLQRAREAAVEALRRLSPDDVFSLVVYDDRVQTIVPAQSARYSEGIISRIHEIRPGGSTALFGGVSQGAAEIRKFLDRPYVHRIILLSDGLANVGPRTPEDLGRLGAALIKESISVTTIGVGTDYNEDLMARLSQKSDGNTYFVESSVDLPGIFGAELGDVLSVVATRVRVTVEFPALVRPLGIIGREGRISGRKVELSMNQLYGNQEKYALVEVEIPPGEDGASMAIASATVTYENPFTHQGETVSGRSIARFSRDRKAVDRSANVGVVRDYQLNLNALAQEEAIALSDKGETRAAAQALKASAEKLKEVGGAYNVPQLLERAEDIETQADAIESEGMTKKSRKLLRTDSYQLKHQQKSR